jgi:flagellar biosynthesis/type III secretory pathway M-ring protein FliF/YscJ
MEFLNWATAHLRDLYRSMSPGSRLATGLLAAVAAAGVAYLCMTRQAAAPEVDLMHGVPVAAVYLPAVEAALAKANLTSYEIRGTSIFVPRGQEAVYMAALVKEKALPPNFGEPPDLAAAENNFLETNVQREERIKSAKRRALSLAICAMPGIERADVIYDHDDRPGPFKDKVITATVSVKPVGTSQLDQSRVTAIRHHVAGAIAGLKPENVVVSDLNGRTWYGDLQQQNADASGRPQAVAAAAPPNGGGEQAATNQPPQAAPTIGPDRSDGAWMRPSWIAPTAIGLALVGYLALRLLMRGRPAAGKEQKTLGAGSSDGTAGARPGVAPPPHWPRQSRAAGPSPSEELSALVEEDPETAANILRNWIGQAS